MVVNWENLGKNALDPTTIDSAIDAALESHNGDPNAHFGEGGALESHRNSEIIDHRAESVVNDKLAARARRYVAIVDPDSEHDFDTIEGAVDYAIAQGGGDIFITRGYHYISNDLLLPHTLSLIGEGYSETQLLSFDGEPKYIDFYNDETASSGDLGIAEIRGIGVDMTDSTVSFGTVDTNISINISECHNVFVFKEVTATETMTYEKCVFECYNISWNPKALVTGYNDTFRDCVFNANTDNSRGLELADGVSINNCRFLAKGFSNHYWIFGEPLRGTIYATTFEYLHRYGFFSDLAGAWNNSFSIIGTTFHYGANTSATPRLSGAVYIGCLFTANGALTVTVDSQTEFVRYIGCAAKTAINTNSTLRINSLYPSTA